MTKWELREEFKSYKIANSGNDLTYTQWLEEMAMRYLDSSMGSKTYMHGKKLFFDPVREQPHE
jgi:hypothetical protein